MFAVFAIFNSYVNLYGAEINRCELPNFTIGKTPVAPKLDGRLDDAAWKYAVALGGFKLMSKEPAMADDSTQVFMTYDSQNIYIAFKSALRGKKPRTTVKERDLAVWRDDSIEIILVPPHLKNDQRYHAIFNSAGAIYDAFEEHGIKAKESNNKWNADWKVANYVWDFEWVLEISVPFADFDVNEAAYGKWKLNFGRSYEQRTAWSYTSIGYNDLDRLGTLTFADNIIINHLSSIDDLKFGDLAVRGKLFNPTKEKKNVKLELLIGKDLCSQNGIEPIIKNIELDGGEEKPYTFEAILKDLELNNLHLNISEDNKDIYKAVCPFTLKKFLSFSIIAAPDSNTVLIDSQISRLDANGPINLKISFADSNNQTVKNIIFENLISSGLLTSNIEGLALGKYKVLAEYSEAKTGKVLDSVAQDFQKNPTPEWFTIGKDLGRNQIVLSPFTPVILNNNSISIWGRKYTFAKNGFLFDEIITQKESLLSGHFSLVADSEKAAFVERQVEDVKPYHVIWRDTYKVGSFTAKCKFTTEYDGMVKAELSLNSQEACDINSLYIEFPINAKFTRLCHYSDNYYGAATSRGIPAGGLNMDFKNYVWLGNPDVGLMWFSEGMLNWNCENKPIFLNSTGMRVNFIDTKTRIDKPIEITFGMIATPVRPISPDWHAYNDVPEPIFDFADGVSRINVIWYSDGRTDDGRYFRNVDDGSFTAPLNKDIKMLKNFVDAPGNENRKNIYMQYFSGVCPKATDYDKYISIWKRLPLREADFQVGKRPQDHVLTQTCYNSCFADYMLYSIKYLVEKTGIDGMYFDGLGVTACENHLHGCNKRIINGKQVDITPIFAGREFHKRLATMLYELKGERAFVLSHISGCISLPILSFTQATLDGECPGRMSSRGAPPITELTTWDYWLAHTQGASGGIAPLFIIYTDKMIPKKQSVYRNYLTMFLPHGIPFMGNEMANDPIAGNLTSAIVKTMSYVDIAKAEFHGYWKSSDITFLKGNSDVVASFYLNKSVNPQRVMVIISNRGKKEADLEIKMSTKVFGELKEAKAFSVSDDYEGEFASDNTLDMKIGAEDFRAFVIIQKDAENEMKHPNQIEDNI